MNPKEPPKGCMEIPGYICEVVEGSAWLTKDGKLTTVWQERGVWNTPEEAQKAAEKAMREE
jgi:hypothetical protein